MFELVPPLRVSRTRKQGSSPSGLGSPPRLTAIWEHLVHRGRGTGIQVSLPWGPLPHRAGVYSRLARSLCCCFKSLRLLPSPTWEHFFGGPTCLCQAHQHLSRGCYAGYTHQSMGIILEFCLMQMEVQNSRKLLVCLIIKGIVQR